MTHQAMTDWRGQCQARATRPRRRGHTLSGRVLRSLYGGSSAAFPHGIGAPASALLHQYLAEPKQASPNGDSTRNLQHSRTPPHSHYAKSMPNHAHHRISQHAERADCSSTLSGSIHVRLRTTRVLKRSQWRTPGASPAPTRTPPAPCVRARTAPTRSSSGRSARRRRSPIRPPRTGR